MIGKQRHIIDFTLSSLLRRKGKNLALLGVYTLVVFAVSSVILFTGALKREAALVLKNAPEIVVQRVLAGRYDTIPMAYAEKLRAIRGVMEVHPRLWGYYYDPQFKANYTLMTPRDVRLAPGEIAVGHGVSSLRRAYEGDMFSFSGHDGSIHNLAIREILPAESALVDSDLILLTEPDYRRIAGVPEGKATDLVLSVRNRNELVTIAEKITRILPDTRPIIRDEILRTYDAAFNWRGGILIVFLVATMLAFVIFAWDKATGLSAEERKEIGILKAIGWETSDILTMKFWEGMTLSLTAFLTGVMLAYAHVFFGSSFLIVPVLKGWSTLYPQFRLTPFVDFGQISSLFFLTVLPYTISTIIPSWRAATIDPDAVMRQ